MGGKHHACCVKKFLKVHLFPILLTPLFSILCMCCFLHVSSDSIQLNLIHPILTHAFNVENYLINVTLHYLIMPGLAKSYLQITIITIRAVGPTVNVIGCHYGMDHLYKSSRCMNFASYSCLFHGIIRCIFIAVGDV